MNLATNDWLNKCDHFNDIMVVDEGCKSHLVPIEELDHIPELSKFPPTNIIRLPQLYWFETSNTCILTFWALWAEDVQQIQGQVMMRFTPFYVTEGLKLTLVGDALSSGVNLGRVLEHRFYMNKL